MIKKILLALLAILLLIQFIRPEKNIAETISENEIQTSSDVKNILQTSCYDCHSNHTNYPWYSNIQPIASWLNNHIDEGKDELNFSEFNAYTLKRKLHKLKEIIEQLEENEMPLWSYTLIHSETKLNEEQKHQLIAWCKNEMENLKSKPL
jgi:hypothetical protein